MPTLMIFEKKINFILNLIFLQLYFIAGVSVYGQNFNKTALFTTNDGLPSNHIYDFTEDNNGFLWIATDNGVCRFDGKYFYNYSVKNGLPSNDALQIIKENDGTIWVNCFNELPSYFDEINNQFVQLQSNSTINKIGASLLQYIVLANGGIKFFNTTGFFDVINKKPKKSVFTNTSGSILIDTTEVTLYCRQSILQTKDIEYKNYFEYNKKCIGNFIEKSSSKSISRIINSNKYYSFFSGNTIYQYSNFKKSPFSFIKKTIIVPEIFKWYKFSTKYLCVIGNSGAIYIYDLQTLKLHTTVANTYQTNCAYIDSHNNLWLGTLENGLIYYNLSKIKKVLTSNEITKSNFLSIAVTPTREILAGNFNGQIVELKNGISKIHSLPFENKNSWIRKLIYANKTLLVVNDAGFSINLKNNQPIIITEENNANCSLKTAIKFNDSTAIVGATKGLFELNIHNGKYKRINAPNKRVLSIANQKSEFVYFINTDGLYQYNCYKKVTVPVLLNSVTNRNKPSFLFCSNDNLVWVATNKGDIFILKGKKLLYKIKNSEGLPGNITNLISNKNKIWLASKSGIYVINYKIIRNQFKFTVNKLSKSDGLTSNIINELAFYKDTIYVATDNGISIIPADIKFSNFEIKPIVISIKVNNKKRAISNIYNLKNEEKNISIQLSGVELSGHFKIFQYYLNDENSWIDLVGNTINLSLKDGNTNLYIRAIDENNAISAKKIKIKFKIAILFYKKPVFWIFLISICMAIIFWWYNRRKLHRQKTFFLQQLALGKLRNKITADLHDDIGATLSSLQINSVVANQLLNTNPKEAQKVLKKIEIQSRNLADKIGDIIWSMKPGKDEFMTLSMRIKNFVNDILGSGNINYSIQIDSGLDNLINDITIRKNIVLIIKEGVNNVAKYSKASELQIKGELTEKTIIIEIIDNGIGFDTKVILGNGIQNMQKRAQELKGNFEIISALNAGTTIRVIIPFLP